MLYEEFPEWKQLKREKKYKETVEKLMYEIAVNLMRVSNLYCDDKYDPYKKYYIACGPCYGENMNGLVEKKLHDYTYLAGYLQSLNMFLEDDDVQDSCKYLFRKLREIKKSLIKLMKNI